MRKSGRAASRKKSAKFSKKSPKPRKGRKRGFSRHPERADGGIGLSGKSKTELKKKFRKLEAEIFRLESERKKKNRHFEPTKETLKAIEMEIIREKAEAIEMEIICEAEALRRMISDLKFDKSGQRHETETAGTETRQNTSKWDDCACHIIRGRHVLIFCMGLAMICGIFISVVPPQIYEAETLILAEPKRIPDKYVESLPHVDMKQRVGSITQQVKSRTYVEQVIRRVELFSGPAYKNMLLEEKVAAVRRNMRVEVIKYENGTDSFKISYKGRYPEKIATAVDILSNFFIDESVKAIELGVMGASVFLQEELRAKAERLESIEAALTEYRIKYMGELPEQRDTNLRMIGMLYARLNEKERMIGEERERLARFPNDSEHYKNSRKNIKNCENTVSELHDRISDLEKRIERLPKRQQEMASLERDHETIRQVYESLLAKKLDADMVVSMERRGMGTRFRILDKARVPEKPISPNIMKIFFISIASGLCAGLGIIFLANFFDTSLRKREDIEALTGIPVIAEIPRMHLGFWDKTKHGVGQALTYVFIVADIFLFVIFLLMALKGTDFIWTIIKSA